MFKLRFITLFFIVTCMTSAVHSNEEIIEGLDEAYSRSACSLFDPMPVFDQHAEVINELKRNFRTDAEKEATLTTIMSSLVDKLFYNYNPACINYIKENAPWDLQLKLALHYFERTYPFTSSNVPANCAQLNRTIAGIYLSVWNSVLETLNECSNEITRIIGHHDELCELSLSNLTPSQRNLVFQRLSPAIASRGHVNVNNVRLSSLSAEDLEDLETALIYIINPFTLVNLKQFTWCARNVLGDEDLVTRLYNYTKEYQEYLNNGGGREHHIPPLDDWLEGAGPANQFNVFSARPQEMYLD